MEDGNDSTTPSEVALTPKDAIQVIFGNFAKERNRDATKAFQRLRQDLADYAYILVPDVIALDGIISNMIKLEDFLNVLKTKGGDTGKPAMQVVADFLSSPTIVDDPGLKVQ